MEYCKRCFRNILESYPEDYDIESLSKRDLCQSCEQQRIQKRAEVFNEMYTMNLEGEPLRNIATVMLIIAYLYEERK